LPFIARAPTTVEVICGWVFVTVISPVEEVMLMPVPEINLLAIQFVPLEPKNQPEVVVAIEFQGCAPVIKEPVAIEGKEKVQVFPEEEDMLNPELPEVAKVPAQVIAFPFMANGTATVEVMWG